MGFFWGERLVRGDVGVLSKGSKHSFLYWPFVHNFYLCSDKKKGGGKSVVEIKCRKGVFGALDRVVGCY